MQNVSAAYKQYHEFMSKHKNFKAKTKSIILKRISSNPFEIKISQK